MKTLKHLLNPTPLSCKGSNTLIGIIHRSG